MPQLSIVIPFRGQHQALEQTLVSVLENRPEDCEILVVHDGSYTDPYQLGDELVFVEADKGASQLEMLNAGVLAACSPFVHTLLDGSIVTPEWTKAALDKLTNSSKLAAVAVPVIDESTGKQAMGVSRSIRAHRGLLPRSISNLRSELRCAGPHLACGFYRKSVLVALDGFCDADSRLVADYDFALAIDALKLDVDTEDSVPVVGTHERIGAADQAALAGLQASYDVCERNFATIARGVLSGGLSGRFADAIQWTRGLISVGSQHAAVHDRVAEAKTRMDSREEVIPFSRYQTTSDIPARRAA